MSAATQTLTGIILGARPRKERYVHWELFSASEGIVNLTVPQKLAMPYGVFDSVDLMASVKSKSFFANEIHLLHRPDALARNPKGFLQAGELAALVKKAFNQMPDYESIFEILQKALVYYADGLPAKAVTLKAFYLMLQAEGFGVKQDWLENLSSANKELAKQTLYAPLEEMPADIGNLQNSLTQWASGELGFSLV